MYAGLQKALPSSKLGVPGVLAGILGLLLEDPEVLSSGVLCGICVAKDIMMHTVCRIRRTFFELVEHPSAQDKSPLGA